MKGWGAACLMTVGTVGCGTTPLDSVVAEVMSSGGTDGGGQATGGSSATAGSGAAGAEGGSSGSGNGGSAGTEPNAGAAGSAGSDCQVTEPTPGRYQILDRVGNRCLQKGEPDPTLYPVFAAWLSGDCAVPEAEWELREINVDQYAIFNVGGDANLDVRAGLTNDGTPIVLYTPRPGKNQLFEFQHHEGAYFALMPQHAVGKCVEAIGAGAQLYPCNDTNRAQDFELVRVDCP